MGTLPGNSIVSAVETVEEISQKHTSDFPRISHQVALLLYPLTLATVITCIRSLRQHSE